MGFWAAIRDVFPETRHQREWVHKTRNVLDTMPKSVHGRARKAIRERITEAENKGEARRAVEAFSEEFGTKWPKAVEKIKEKTHKPCSPTTTSRPSIGGTFGRPTP